jgi:6-phosphogluconate dehydrogenase
MSERRARIGIVGLGVMGRNLLLNAADHGFPAVGYDKDGEKATALEEEGAGKAVAAVRSLEELTGRLSRPRAVLMLVPAGPAVDSVTRDLLPQLEAGDLIIDAGNSHFTDTELRQKALDGKGIHFLGVGVSGGESGARHGPSMMPGGPREAYGHVEPLLESIAAHVDGEPCVTYLGPRGAGHFVKMVHNGIEYGVMQLIAETYDLMKRGLGLDDDRLHAIYDGWNRTELASFLLEITAKIFVQNDEQTGRRLIDVILDVAKQKGTGMWTSQAAMDLQVPVPTIDVAVAMRNLSAREEERSAAQEVLRQGTGSYGEDAAAFVARVRNALYAGVLATYAQGMDLLSSASRAYDYGLDLEAVARIWRGGCIIRAALLEEIRRAYGESPGLPNLLLTRRFAGGFEEALPDLRTVVATACTLGIPVPGLMSVVAYYDAWRSRWLPASLIQAQRDYFGSHTYERIDERGQFHTHWDSGA